ncbi:MAG: tail fiber domain-containing protein, partial [Candidatus Fonsibacter sp.]
VGSDMRGRFIYTYATAQFDWCIASSFTPKMTLKSAGLYLGATLVSASDKRLKFNEKPLVNALNIINKLEPVEYDQTYDLVENYTQETPQSHQCGFIAQSVEKIDELKYIVAGGEIGEDGKESLRGINY